MIVDYEVESNILSHALSAAPDMELRLERLDGSSDIPLRNVFWASGDDFEAFEAAAREDPTVSEVRCLAETPSDRLYSAHYDADLPDVEAYRTTLELGGVVLDARSGGDRWHVRFQFPDWETAREFRERVDGPGFDLTLQAIYQRRQPTGPEGVDLTETQRETLRLATEMGYFRIPRDASLADVAGTVGVSKQATSERLRRGIDSLVRSTLGVAGEPPAEGSTSDSDPSESGV